MFKKFFNLKADQQLYVLAAVCLFLLLPFIGLTDFYSNKESEEAVVSLAMLRDDNLLLPMTYGADVSVAPPFLHWCVACAMSFFGTGEFASRLPSAIALSLLCIGFFLFFRKRSGVRSASLVAALCLTSLQLHSSAYLCASDMIFTSAVALSALGLLSWHEDNLRLLPWFALPFMIIAVLTKGLQELLYVALPFILLLLIKREKPLRILLKSLAVLLIPAAVYLWWRYEAYAEGGEMFADAVKEDDANFFGAMMRYEDMDGGVLDNLCYIIIGMMPWTLFLAASLFFLPLRSMMQSAGDNQTFAERIKDSLLGGCKKLAEMSAIRVYFLLIIITVVVACCVPDSKGGALLMPAYPFIAYFLSIYIEWCEEKVGSVAKVYTYILCAIAVILAIAHFAISFAEIPDGLFTFADGEKITEILRSLAKLDSSLLFILLCATGMAVFYALTRNGVFASVGMSMFLCLFLDAVTLPTVRNSQSVKWFAEAVSEEVPFGYVYSFSPADMDPDQNYRRYHDINFYTSDRIRLYIKDRPPHGLMLVRRDYLEEYRNGLFLGIDFKAVMWTDKAYGEEDDVMVLVEF